LEELGEDLRRLHAAHAAERVEVLDGELSVDLREQKAGAVVDVEPEDLVGAQHHAGTRGDRGQLRLVKVRERLAIPREVVLRQRVVRLQLEDLFRDAQRSREVAELVQLLHRAKQRRKVLPGGIRLTRHGRRRRDRNLRRPRFRPPHQLQQAPGPIVSRVEFQDAQKAGGRLFVVAENVVPEALLEKTERLVLHPRIPRCSRIASQSSTVCCSPARIASGAPWGMSCQSRAARRQASALARAAVPQVLARMKSRARGRSRSPFSRRSRIASRCERSNAICALAISLSFSRCTIRWSSSLVSPPKERIWIDCSRPVCRSRADTERMPSAEMSNCTSISTSPRRPFRRGERTSSPRTSLSAARSLSPCSTRIRALSWSSRTVVKTCEAQAGTVVLRAMSTEFHPPAISTPSEWGVTSSRRRSLERCAMACACSAAPSATASSG